MAGRSSRNSLGLLKSPAKGDLTAASAAGAGPWGTPAGGLPRPREIFDSGAFGPMPPAQPFPIDPTAGPYGLADPRVAEYLPGYNLPTQPGYPEKLVPFSVLIDLVRLVTPLRKAIDVRKQEVGTQEWDLVLRDEHANLDDGNGELRTRIQRELKAFLQRPDPYSGRTFSAWIRLAEEELMVKDALSIWLRPTRGARGGVLQSGLASLEIIPGDTIKPLRDIRGARPLPPFPAFIQYLYGAPRTEFTFPLGQREEEERESAQGNDVVQRFTTNELVYRPFNERTESMYGFSVVEAALPFCQLWLRRHGWHLAYFDDGDIPGMMVPAPKEWQPEQIRSFEAGFNRQLAGDVGWKHRVKFIPGGAGTPFLAKPPIYDMTFDEWIERGIAMCCDVDPLEIGLQPKHGLGGGGWAEQAAQRQVRLSLLPHLIFHKEILDWIIGEVLGHPEFEVRWQNLYQEDRLVQAQIDAIYLDKGAMTRQEVRERNGWAKRDEQAVDVLTISGDVKPLERALEPPQPPAFGLPGGPDVPPAGGAPTPPDAPTPKGPADGDHRGPDADGSDRGAPAWEPAAAGAEGKKAALAELGAWERWYERRGGAPSRAFETKAIPAPLARRIQGALTTMPPRMAKVVFAQARAELAAEGDPRPFVRKYSDDQPRDEHGRWTDGGGDADAGGGDQEQGIIDRLQQTGGATYGPSARQFREAGATGYAVSPYRDRQQTLDHTPTVAELRAYVARNADLLGQPDHYFGVWRDPATGKVHLDVTVIKEDRDEAVRLAREHNQLAIFDFQTGTTIDTRPGADPPGNPARKSDRRAARGRDPVPVPGWRGRAAPELRRPDLTKGHNSLLIAFRIPEHLRDQVRFRGLAPRFDPGGPMHLTLAVIDGWQEIPDAEGRALGAVAAAIREWGDGPLDARISGVGRFVGTEGDQGDPFYLSVDAPDLPEFREILTDCLDDAGLEPNASHGYTPHVTWAYLHDADTIPTLEAVVPFQLSDVIVRAGDGATWATSLTSGHRDDLVKAPETEAERRRRLRREYEAADETPEPPPAPSAERRDGLLAPIASLLAARLIHNVPKADTAEARLRGTFARSYTRAYRAGLRMANPRHRWDEADAATVARLVDEQLGYLGGFVQDVQSGDWTEAQIAARSRLYGEPLWGAFARGFVRGSAETGTAAWTWNTQDDATVCALCAPRDGQRYDADALETIGYPGSRNFSDGPDGCAGACRCWLEPVAPEEE